VTELSVIREAFFIAFGTHHDKLRPVLATTATESGCFRALGNGGNAQLVIDTKLPYFYDPNPFTLACCRVFV
jgi:hypothetical protein